MVPFLFHNMWRPSNLYRPSGIKASSRIVLPVNWTRPSLVVYINSSSPLEILETLQTMSSTSLTRTKMVLLTLKSSSVLSVLRVADDWTRSSSVRYVSFRQPHLSSLPILSRGVSVVRYRQRRFHHIRRDATNRIRHIQDDRTNGKASR